jgi:Tol biopolymer transport system component
MKTHPVISSGSSAVVQSAAIVGALLVSALVVSPAIAKPPVPPVAVNQDSLIRPGEKHFKRLWQITFGGENAEGYWSNDDKHLIFQSTRDGYPCDQQYVMNMATGDLRRVSTGTGRTTCGYFYDRDQRVLFASTHGASDSCPPVPDMSLGYVWPISPGYDLWSAKPDGSDLKRMTNHPGYDAEATVSVDGKWIIYTAVQNGDLDLFKMRPDGSDVTRLTDQLGYDGGAFFSRDGKWICYRRDSLPDEATKATFRDLLARDMVRPGNMDLWVMRADGSGKRQVTSDAGASFAPFFTPDGKKLIYSSNRHNPRGRDFDLFLVDLASGAIEPVTREESFDGFPMFNRNGKWLVFASNRGAKVRGETNLFLAEWKN